MQHWPDDSRIPVTLLTGFLGSGKTTLLQQLLRQKGADRTLVIINEFGEIGLDHLLLVESTEGVTVELNNCCLCCTIRHDLVHTLRDARWRFARGGQRWFDRVVIETTGIADPAPIVYSLLHEPVLAKHYRLAGIVTTVDLVNAQQTLDHYPEAVKQVALADTLLLTKSDLAKSTTASAVSARLHSINPDAVQHRFSPGELAPDILSIPMPFSNRQYSNTIQQASLAAEGQHDLVATHEHHHIELHNSRINSFCLSLDIAFDREQLRDWLGLLANLCGERLLRLKGIVAIRGEATPAVIHIVQHSVHPVVLLPAWPDAGRQSRFVFITSGLDRQVIEGTLPVPVCTTHRTVGLGASP